MRPKHRIGRIKPRIRPHSVLEPADHGRLGFKRHIAAGILQQRHQIIARLTHLRELEIQHPHPRNPLAIGQPKQVLRVIIAQDHDPRPIGMGGHHIFQRRPKAGPKPRPVALGSNRGLAIPVQRKATGLSPVCRAQIAKPGHRCLSLQRTKDIGRALIEGHLPRGVRRHKPGKTAVPEILEQQKAMR